MNHQKRFWLSFALIGLILAGISGGKAVENFVWRPHDKGDACGKLGTMQDIA